MRKTIDIIININPMAASRCDLIIGGHNINDIDNSYILYNIINIINNELGTPLEEAIVRLAIRSNSISISHTTKDIIDDIAKRIKIKELKIKVKV